MVGLPLYVAYKGLHQLDERLLTLVAGLGAWGLGRWQQAAGRGRGGATAEMTGQAGEEGAQFRAKLLFESLFVSGGDAGVLQTADSLGDEHVETVLHGEHQQRLEGLGFL